MRRWLLLVVLTFAAALGGVFLGRALLPRSEAGDTELHHVIHEQLDLDQAQERRIKLLEQRSALRRRALELEMRAANMRLADAIEVEHGIGPRVTAAVDGSHRAMGELQKETLAHLFLMRRVLRPDQARKFDQAVVRALTVDRR